MQVGTDLGDDLCKECFAAGSPASSTESCAFKGLGRWFAAKYSAFWVRHKTEVLNACIFS